MQHHSAPRGDIRFNCPMAARCGGCQLSRLSYREQLALKQRHVAVSYTHLTLPTKA